MKPNRVIPRYFLSAVALLSLAFPMLNLQAQDLVSNDDVTGGASVFVFRESRKKPQERGGGGSARAGGGRSGFTREKVNTQIAANRKRRADQAKANQVMIARARARERNAKIKLSNTLTARADVMLEKGDVAGATTNYRSALTAYPKNAEAASGLSEALTAKGIETAGANYNESAAPFLTEAVKLNPKNASAYAKLGEIHEAHGRSAEAAKNYELAIAADPDMTSLYAPLGLAYVDAGEVAKAETYLTKAESSGTSTPETRLARAVLLYKQNRNDDAMRAVDAIIAAEPQNAAANYQKALIFARMDQPAKSADALKRTIQVDPAFAPAYFDLGVIAYNSGDYNEALKDYKEAVRLDAANSQAHANLASTYRQLERYSGSECGI